MTVKQLIEKLQKFPPSHDVWVVSSEDEGEPLTVYADKTTPEPGTIPPRPIVVIQTW